MSRKAPEATPVDAVAKRRAFDLKQLSGPRFVAVAHFKRPPNQFGLDFLQSIIE